MKKVAGIIIPSSPPPGVVDVLREFVDSVSDYDVTGVWPDNGTIRRLAERGKDALGGRGKSLSLQADKGEKARLREALEEIAKDTVSVPCDDPQCGDSTWDHNCTAGRRKPSHLAEIAIRALGEQVEAREQTEGKPIIDEAETLIRWLAENGPIPISDRAYKWLDRNKQTEGAREFWICMHGDRCSTGHSASGRAFKPKPCPKCTEILLVREVS